MKKWKWILGMLIALYIAVPVWADEEEEEIPVNPYLEKVEKAKLWMEEATTHFPKIDPTKRELSKKSRPKGLLDPRFPDTIEIEQQKVSIPRQVCSFFFTCVGEEEVELLKIKPNTLKKLSVEQLKILLEHFNAIPIELLWKDKTGYVRSGKEHFKVGRKRRWNKTNASGVLGLRMGALHETELLTKMLSVNPDPILNALQGEAASVMDVQIAASVLVDLMGQVTSQNTRQIASSAQNLVNTYIGYWADEYADQMVMVLTNLILETAKRMQTQAFSIKQKGILLGAFLSGAIANAQKIKSKDEKRLWIINSISNLAWAATTFLGIVPIAGSISAGVAATLSIGVVVWATVYNKIGARDFTPKLKEIEGHIEFSALDAAHTIKRRETMFDVLEMLAWMRATIHVNGFSD